jgi:ABC-2 type transport system ATP-binding protein
MLQKVQFLAAIIHEPDLLILDEPFSGLDPISMRLLRDVILEEHKRGATILFSTHVMPQAEEICQHVVMIHRGRKVLDEDLAAIRRQYDPRTIRFDPLDSSVDPSGLRALAEVERVDRVEGSYEIHLVEGTDPATAIRRITMAITPARIELSRPRLEDVFIRIVSDGASTNETEQILRAGLRDDLGAPTVTV